MKRRVEKDFADWQGRKDRKPLIVRGARQVGKTYSIRDFGRSRFKTTMVVDLERQRTFHAIFSGDLSPAVMLPQLEALGRQRIVPGETLLFLDEIQACPRAVMALRYFQEQLPELHVIAAGSLLEFALEAVSFPVGRVEFLWMYPMSFEEFLLAQDEGLLNEQRPNLDSKQPVPEAIHARLMDQLRQYFIVGGMPEAVRSYISNHSPLSLSRIHGNLIEAYQQDFAKYGGRIDRDCLLKVFETVPARVGEQIKYAPLYPEKRIETIKGALRIMERALLLHKVSCTSAQGLPLGSGLNERFFKYVFVDIGLMRHLCGLSADVIFSEPDLLNTFRGSLAEQFIGQSLLAERGGCENNRLYYWARTKRNSSAEVDYVIARDGRIIPLEVKSGPPGKLRSLKLFLEEHRTAGDGLVFHCGEVTAASDRMKFLPLYSRLAEPVKDG